MFKLKITSSTVGIFRAMWSQSKDGVSGRFSGLYSRALWDVVLNWTQAANIEVLALHTNFEEASFLLGE